MTTLLTWSLLSLLSGCDRSKVQLSVWSCAVLSSRVGGLPAVLHTPALVWVTQWLGWCEIIVLVVSSKGVGSHITSPFLGGLRLCHHVVIFWHTIPHGAPKLISSWIHYLLSAGLLILTGSFINFGRPKLAKIKNVQKKMVFPSHLGALRDN